MGNKKDDKPYMPFYIGDWFKAPEVRALPHANRMVWFEILCLMWQGDEKGVLSINNQPFVITDDITGDITHGKQVLAAMLGISCEFLQDSFHFFKRFGVYKVRNDGAIYSGFMTKLVAIKESKSIAGKKGMRNRYSNSVITRDITLSESEYIYTVLKEIEERDAFKMNDKLKNNYMFLIAEMIKSFLEKNPDYFFEKETDYHACLQIAHNIATMKKWQKSEVTNGKMDETLVSWKKIIAFVANDTWLKTRTLSDLSTTNEWQRLVQKMGENVIATSGKKMHY